MLKTTERDIPDEIQLAHEPDIQIGKAWLRPASLILESGGKPVQLEPRVAQLLVALARRPGEVVGRDDLVDLCWGGRIVGEDAINRCIAKARKASGGAGFEITTIPKVGYALAAEVEAAGNPFLSRWVHVAGGVAVLFVALLGYSYWGRDRSPPQFAYPPIAVGQFTARSDRRDLIGPTSEIGSRVVDALLRVGVPTMRGNLPRAGDGYSVRGEVSAQADGIHTLVQLDDVVTKRTIASRELNIDPDELPLLGDKVAASVADAVTQTGAYYALTASGTDREEMSAFMSIALQVAAGDYLKAEARARQFFDSRPQSRLAPFALTFATIYAIPEFPVDDRPRAIARARRAAALARERLPQFGDVYIAQCKLYPVDLAACERIARKALVRDPSAPTMRSQLALLLMNAGRLEEARPFMARSLAETAFNPSKVIQALYLAQLTGSRTEESYVGAYADRYWPRLRFANQRFASLMANGRWVEAERMLPLVARRAPGSEVTLKTVFAALHQPTAGNKDRVEAACNRDPAVAVACFSALSMLGRTSAGIKVADRLYPPLQAGDPSRQEKLFIANGSDPGPLFFIWGDGAKAMRRDPGFTQFADQLGLIRYWRASGPPNVCRREAIAVCKLAASR